MSKQSFADLGVSRAVVRRARRAAASPRPSPSSALVIERRARRAATCSSSRPPDRARRSRSASRSSSASSADGPRPAALVLAPTRELASQIVEEIRDIAHARALRVAAVYGGVGLAKQAARRRAVPHRRRDARAASRTCSQRGAFKLDAIRDARARRGRPHARHGLPPGRRPHRRARARASARRCSSPPRSTAPSGASPRSTRATRSSHEHGAVGIARDGRRRAPLRRGRRRRPRRGARRRAAPRSATSRSCSCAPSAAPTASSSASAAAA